MASNAAEKKETNDAAEQALPLFYQQPAMLHKDRHAKASVAPNLNYAFARGTNSLGLNLIEFMEAGKFYPIVFTGGAEPMPAAILGMEQDNYFINAKGEWKSDTYIPAYARQYPFIFFERPEDTNFYLCIDEKAPHFNASTPEGNVPLFKDDGNPSELTENALKFCSAYYEDHKVTRVFCQALQDNKLFTPSRWDMETKEGKKVSLANFFTIDEQAFNQLPDEVILDFRKKGWLPFIYFAMASTSNWQRVAGMKS